MYEPLKSNLPYVVLRFLLFFRRCYFTFGGHDWRRSLHSSRVQGQGQACGQRLNHDFRWWLCPSKYRFTVQLCSGLLWFIDFSMTLRVVFCLFLIRIKLFIYSYLEAKLWRESLLKTQPTRKTQLEERWIDWYAPLSVESHCFGKLPTYTCRNSVELMKV